MSSKLIAKRETETARIAKIKKARAKRSRRWMVAGIAICVVTFIVKEVLRDQLKGLSDSIAVAQKAVDEREAAIVATARQVTLTSQMKLLSDQAGKVNASQTTTKSDVQIATANLMSTYTDAAQLIDRISDLLDTLPKGADPLRKEREKVRDDLEVLRKETLKTVTENSVPNPDWHNHTLLLVGGIEVCLFELKSLSWQMKVMVTAENVKEAADTLYRDCTWLSYFLILVGIVIAAYGKLSARGSFSLED
jgi:hypothetical protein